jgi:hypothetical protein
VIVKLEIRKSKFAAGACHPERSEGSPQFALRRVNGNKTAVILRFAQDDRFSTVGF